MSVSQRKINLIGLVICSALLGLAYYLQYVKGIQPCLLCLTQRGLFWLLAVIFLLTCLHNPQRRGRKIYASLAVISCLLGLAAAGRQLWLQQHPVQANSLCVPELNYLLTGSPISETLEKLIHGSDSCGIVAWSFLNLSLASWSLIFFVVLLIIALWQIKRA